VISPQWCQEQPSVCRRDDVKNEDPEVNLASLRFWAPVYAEVLTTLEDPAKEARTKYYLAHADEASCGHSVAEARMLLFLQHCLPGVLYLDERDDVSGDVTEMVDYLLHLRQTSAALSAGDYRLVPTAEPSVLSYVLESSWSKCYLLFNFGQADARVEAGRIGQWVAGTEELYGDGTQHTGGSIRLAPGEARLYEQMRKAQVDVPAI
jgi:hypothetical protein